MKKKIKNIVIFSILGFLGVVYAVLYILYPENTKNISASVLNYICEKPLPVIGISILTLGILILKIISATGLGNKSLKECREHLAESKEANEKTHEELLAFEEAVNKKIDDFIYDFTEKHNSQMKEICCNIPNKNVKELGERFYGTKENSETVE